MYVLLVACEAVDRRSTIHLVNENGLRVFSAKTVQEALAWLDGRGETMVVAMTDVGAELFLIEPCDGLAMSLPAHSLRRAHYGRCCNPPPLPGLGSASADRTQILEDRLETPAESRRRRATWIRRATSP